MNGVRTRRLCLALIAFVADIGDVEARVHMTGGKVARGGKSRYFKSSAQRRVAVDFDVRRCFTHDEQFFAE